MTTKKLYVGNLPKGCTSQMLSEIFEKFGAVAECDVIRNYGFVVRIRLKKSGLVF